MSGLVWAFLGAAAAVTTEVYIKTHPTLPYLRVAPVAIGSSMLIAYCIYRLLHAETLIGATVFFALGTALARVGAATLILAEPVPTATWVAFGLTVLASLVKALWR